MINVGVIGTGFGRDIAVCFSSFPGARTLAIAGRDGEKTRRVADDLGIEKSYSDWKELIDDPDIGLVCIASPNFLHREMFEYAVKNNKHILVEKPADITPEGIQSMAKLVKRYEKYAFVSHGTRFNPITEYIRKQILDGRLGDVTAIRVTIYHNWFSDPNTKYTWVNDKTKGGGYIMVVGVHMIDIGRYLAGLAKAVKGLTYSRVIADEKFSTPPTSEAQFGGQYELENGTLLQLYTSGYTQGYKNVEIQVLGSKGILLYDDMEGLRESYGNDKPLKVVEIEDRLAHIDVGRSILSKSMKYLAEGYIDLLQGEKVDMDKFCTLETAAENMEYLKWD